MLKVTDFLALMQGLVAFDAVRSGVPQVERIVEEAKLDTRDQDCRDSDESKRMLASADLKLDKGPLVLAKQPLDSLEGGWVDIPGVPRDIDQGVYPTVTRRVEPVVHARLEAQGNEEPVSIPLRRFLVTDKLGEPVWVTLRLEKLLIADLAKGPDDPVTWADDDSGIGIDGAYAGLQFARKAFMQALEFVLFRLVQPQVVDEGSPDKERSITYDGIAQSAEPTHEQGCPTPRYAVRYQEV